METLADYERWKSSKQQGGVGAAQIVLGTVEETPDQAAGDLNLANEFGKATGNPVPPAAMVKEFRPIFQQAVEAQKNKTVLSSAPRLTEWLRNPENATVAKDDLQNLSWWETTFGASKNALSRFGQGVKLAGNEFMAENTAERARDRNLSFMDILDQERLSLGMRDMAGNPIKTWDGSEPIRAVGRWLDARFADLIGTDDQAAAQAYTQAVGKIAKNIQNTPMSPAATRFKDVAFDDARRAKVEEGGNQGWADTVQFLSDFAADPAGATAFLYETALESLPLAGVGIATGIATRNPAAGAAVMGGASYAQERFREPQDFYQSKGIDISTPEGALRVISDPELMQEAQQRGMLRGAIVGILDGLSGGVAGRELAKSPLANMAIQSVVQAVMGGAGEAGAQAATNGTVDMRQVLVEALAEFASAPVEVAGYSLQRFRDNSAKAAAAEQTRATAEQTSAAAQASALRNRLPDKFRQVVDGAAEGTAFENVFVNGRQFSEYFQAMGIDPFDWINSLEGVEADDLRTAIETDGDVRIPTATYAAKLAGSEHDAFFLDNMKYATDDFSAREAVDFNERAEDIRQDAFDEAERLRLEDEANRTEAQIVYDDFLNRMREAGRSVEEATNVAALYAAQVRTAAADEGMSVAEYLQNFPLPEVRGSVPQGIQRKSIDEVDLAIAAAKNTKVARDGRKSLLEFISEYGGINDQGGELRARNAETIDRGKGKKKLTLARRGFVSGMTDLLGGSGGKKFGVDDVALAAIEAGYMADNPVVNEYRAAIEQGREIPDISRALWDSVDAELRGERQFAEEAGSDVAQAAQLDEMEAYLSSLGVSLSDDPATIRQAIEGARQYAQRDTTQTDAFKAWFGDSKVVDADGNPLVVYHGSGADIEAFDISSSKSGDGIYFTPMPEFASRYAEAGGKRGGNANVYPVYLSIQNPFELGSKGGGPAYWIENAKAKGYDGIIVRGDNGDIRIAVAFDPSQIKSVNNRGTFDGGDTRILFQNTGGVRGSITALTDGSRIISLFQSANLSTMLHETGHMWLINLQDREALGSSVASDRLSAIKKWWRENAADVARDAGNGVTAADVEAAIDTGTTGDAAKDAAIDVGMQEQFAKGFEAYLMEGRAPNAELRTAFSKFAAWLTRIYRSLRNLDVTINDDLRAVFDRILASDMEITKARADLGADHPLFASAQEMGLTDDEYRRLIDLRDRAEAADKSTLLRKVMEPIRREREKWFKEERASLKEEVTLDLQARPEFRSVQELRFGKGFDGEPVAIQKLDRASIERDYGNGYIPLLPGATAEGKGHRNAVFTNEGGVHPDVIADIYGYPSGRELLEALISTPPISEAVEVETDRVMRERHGDVLNDGSIEVEAIDALHNEDKGQWIAAELKSVTDVAGVDVVLTAKEARRVAKETIDRLPVKDAMAAHRYLNAERKAANEAQALARQLGRDGVWVQNARRRIASKARAAIKGAVHPDAVAQAIDDYNAKFETTSTTYNVAEQSRVSPSGKQFVIPGGERTSVSYGYNDLVAQLIDAKRRQLLNHALYSEAKKAAEFVGKVEDKAANLNKSDKKLSKSKNIDFIKAARTVAAKFGLVSEPDGFDIRMWMEQLTFDDPVTASAIADTIKSYASEPANYKKIPFSELSALNDAIDSILETGKRSRQLEIEGKAIDKAEAIDELNGVLEGRGLKRNPALDRELTRGEKTIRIIMGWASSLKRVENWARAMDDGKQGAYTKFIVRPVMDALDAYRSDKNDKLSKLLSIINERRDTLTGKAISAPELNGYTFTNKAALIHAILHTGNPSNMAKLLLGRGWTSGYINQQQAQTPRGKPRFRRDGSPVMTKGDLDTSRWDAFLDRMVKEGTVTADDIKMVNAIWKLNEEIKRPAQSTHRKLFGFYFKEIEAEGYDTAAGRLDGGYVPAVVDNDASNDGVLRAGEAALDQQSAGFLLPTAGSGFTKSRVENYTQPLALDLRLLPSHVDKVLRFTHLDPAVRQVHGLVVDRRFGNTLANYDPTIADNLLIPWLQRVAQQSVDAPASSSAGRSFDNVLRTLRKRVGFNTMFANLVNTAQQITGLSVAATLVKPSYLKNSTVRYARDIHGMRADVFSLSPFMAERVKNATRETQMRIQDVVSEPTKYGEFQQWIEKHGYFMQAAVQSWVDVPVWMAAYEQAVANGLNEKDAVFEADATIRRTMVGMNPEDVSMFESGPAWKRLFTMFYTYFNGQANHLAEQASVTWRQYGWDGKGKLFSLYIFGVLVPALGAEMIAQAARGGLGDDDEDGEYWDDLAGLFFGSQARYGTAMVPVAGQLTQLVFNQFNDQRYDDKLSPSPAISSLERAARSPYSVGRAVFGDGSAQTAVGDGLTALALATGVPVNWLAKPLGYAAGVAEGKFSPENPIDIMQGVVSGRDSTAR